MTRPPSAAGMIAANAPETAEAFLELLTINHASLPEPIRVGSGGQDTVQQPGSDQAAELVAGNDGTVEAGTLVWGPGILFGSGLAWPGQTTTDRLTVPGGVFNGLTDFTLEGTITPERLAVAGIHKPTILACWHSGISGHEVRVQLTLTLPTVNQFHLMVKETTITWDTPGEGLPDLADGTRRRWAIVRDGTTGDAELFLMDEDGSAAVSYGTKSLPTGALTVDAGAARYGLARTTTSSRNFKGGQDDLRVWSVKRSAAAIGADGFGELVGDETDLDAYWPLNEGTRFVACPFALVLPGDSNQRPPKATLAIDAVDPRVRAAVRSIPPGTVATVDIDLVLASQPEIYEGQFPGFDLRNVTYNRGTLRGELTLDSFVREPWPADRYTPGEWRGLF